MCDGRTPFFLSHPSLITIEVTVNQIRMMALLDTGATTSLISSSMVNQVKHSKIHSTKAHATLGDGSTMIEIIGVTTLCITVKQVTTILHTLVVESLGAPLILGMD